MGDPIRTVEDQLRRRRSEARLMAVAILAFAMVLAGTSFERAPQPLALGVLVCAVAATAAMVRPIVGVYVIVFFTMLADSNTISWYPFVANLSSQESIMFIHESLNLNPLELLIAATAVGWFLQELGSTERRFRRGTLFMPIAVFTGFVALALLRAFGSYADRYVALFEARPLLYLLAVYVLVTNLITTRSQYVRLFVFTFGALGIQSVLAINYFRSLPAETRELMNSLTAHGAAVHLAVLFVALLAAFLLGASARLKLVLILATMPSVVVFVLSRRRAAFIAFSIGVILVSIVLFHLARKRFYVFVPIVSVITVVYLAAFWNSDAQLAFGVQAIKSVIAPESVTARNQSSNLYREIEALNLWFTIRVQPLQGVGFGNPFYQPWPLPALTESFELHRFIPHNSFLWIWLKLGFLGFVSMIFMFVRAVQLGARSVLEVRAGTERVIVLTSTCYLVMFLVFAYVDIAWDARNVVFLGLAMAAAGDAVHADPGPEGDGTTTQASRPAPSSVAVPVS